MYCPNCGAPNNDGQLVCANCGLPLEARPSTASGAEGGTPSTPPAGGYPPGNYPPAGNYPPGGGYPPGSYPPGQQWQQGGWAGSGVSYAGFWKRFAAYIIDGILINIVMTIVGYALGIGYVNGLGDAPSGRSAAYSIINIVVFWLYFSLMESSSQQATVGKMALGIVVTDLDGRRVSFGRATGRHWSKIISTLILLIGWLMAGFTERKQALHDIIAGTLVLNKR